MKNKIFMDTGFVMAVVNDKDQYHSDAVKLANRFRNYPMVITDAVLLEIGNALARNFKLQAIDIFNHCYNVGWIKRSVSTILYLFWWIRFA